MLLVSDVRVANRATLPCASHRGVHGFKSLATCCDGPNYFLSAPILSIVAIASGANGGPDMRGHRSKAIALVVKQELLTKRLLDDLDVVGVTDFRMNRFNLFCFHGYIIPNSWVYARKICI